MGESLKNVKDALRRDMRGARAAFAGEVAARRAAAACARLTSLSWYLHARHVVVYTARSGEIDPAAVARAASAAGKSVYYPVVVEGRVNGAAPAAFLGENGVVPPADADDVLFVVPGLAFDSRGVRLGRGGGWYDRMLAGYPRGSRVGFAYDFQVLADLPEDTWDLRMHAVVTDARLIDGVASLGQ
jgi:5-formyltetrahydrofolate cyclo-ligase